MGSFSNVRTDRDARPATRAVATLGSIVALAGRLGAFGEEVRE